MTASPDYQIVEMHLQEAGYILGIRQKKWRFLDQSWPDSVFEVRAKCGKWWGIKINLEGYPEKAPKGLFWSCLENRPLDNNQETPNALGSRDKDQDDVFLAFSSQPESIYAPFDRRRETYDDGNLQCRWTPEKTITFYLENIHALLNSSGYCPAENAATENTDQ